MSSDEGLDALGRELRATTGDELRADAEEGERLAAQAARRGQTLADVARAALFRGDRVRLRTASTTVIGTVVRAAGDLVSVETVEGTVHVRLTAAVAYEIVQRDAVPGRSVAPGPESFRACLLELELAEAEVSIALPWGEVRGQLSVVARDHLVVAGPSGETHLSLAAVDHLRVR